jgi:hypothetical protein
MKEAPLPKSSWIIFSFCCGSSYNNPKKKKTEKQKGGESFCVSGEKIKQVGLLFV